MLRILLLEKNRKKPSNTKLWYFFLSSERAKHVILKKPLKKIYNMQIMRKEVNFKGKSLLSIMDLSSEEMEHLIDLASELKEKKKNGIEHKLCKGKNIVLLFEKTSTRTRCAFEVASYDLGMNVTYLDPQSSQMGKKESIEDTARVLGRMYDAIEYRGFEQTIVEMLAKCAGVPVFNGLTNESHPTQILADFLTIKEKFGSVKGRNFVFYGDARYNMGNSLMVGCAKVGMNFTACTNSKYFPDKALVAKSREIAKQNGCKIDFTEDPMAACKGADVIYTDVWVSMGESEDAWKERIKDLSPYQVTSKIMAAAKKDAIFMHCLPSFHDLNTTIGVDIHKKFGLKEMEVTDEVFRSRQSVVFDEAENRMHTIKAVIAASLA